MKSASLAIAVGFAFSLASVTACTVGSGDADPTDPEADIEGEQDDSVVDPLAASTKGDPGVNSKYCKASDYNCRFRYDDSRITAPDGGQLWAVTPGASVRDGKGDPMYVQAGTQLKFNYGQIRTLAGKAHALAMSTSNGSSGWYPVDHIVQEQAFRARVGNVDAKDPQLGKLACYEVRNVDFPASYTEKKVVKNSQSTNEKIGDYMPLLRKDGKRSANLVFSVPGFGLGGATTDHFPAGTKFQRVKVTTTAGNPSITIPLYVKDGNGDYLKHSGDATFLYGYVVGNGVKRFGWMAQESVASSNGCP